MTDRRNIDTKWNPEKTDDLPRSFTPLNRRKDGAVFRLIRERIREGYYESGAVLRKIAERIAGVK